MSDNMPAITDLEKQVAALSAGDREVFDRIFHVQSATGHLEVPDTMRHWVMEAFGDVEAVCHQRIVKVTNLILLEGTLFNPLRGVRPVELASSGDVMAAIESTRGGPFCHPEELTPVDPFGSAGGEQVPGRIRGKHCVTASNIAKCDGYHGLVIFDEHNPLIITTERVNDYIDTALRWAKRAHNADTQARYFFLMWNCLWKGGASIIHGHMQVTLGCGMHYARIEHCRRQAMLYRLAHGTNFFDDLYRAHAALGLGTTIGQTRLFASLTPVKEREIWLIAPGPWIDNDDFKDCLGTVLQAYVGTLGVKSFNLVLYQRPIDVPPFGSRQWEDWEGFPAIVRVVDRGDLQTLTTDVGCMELYGSSVVASDPFAVIRALVG